MPYRTDIAYEYDGSFDGLMCCVHEIYYCRELPEVISGPDEPQVTLYEVKRIASDSVKAAKVIEAVRMKISAEALEFIRRAFLTCLDRKELHIVEYIRLGFKTGSKISNMLTDDRVAVLEKAVLHLGKEAQLYCGFVRFSELGGVLVSVIEPKNYILPAIMDHFCDRFLNEVFIIYDKTHSMMLLSERGTAKLGYVDSFDPGDADYEERGFRRLWQSFYDTIGIKERYNPRCRMSHMPKRYWAQMTEFWEREPASQKQIEAVISIDGNKEMQLNATTD